MCCWIYFWFCICVFVCLSILKNDGMPTFSKTLKLCLCVVKDKIRQSFKFARTSFCKCCWIDERCSRCFSTRCPPAKPLFTYRTWTANIWRKIMAFVHGHLSSFQERREKAKLIGGRKWMGICGNRAINGKKIGKVFKDKNIGK